MLPHTSVAWLRQATPYINSHRGHTFVVMLPGEAIANNGIDHVIQDLMLLHSLDIRLVLAFGARPQVEKRLAEQKILSQFHQHLRITDEQSLSGVVDAVGEIRIQLERLFSTWTRTNGSSMQQDCPRVMSGNLVLARPMGVIDGVDFLHTGSVRRIDKTGILHLLMQKHIVLLPPLGFSPTGEIFNLCCEQIATQAAIALGASKLILYDAEMGLMDKDLKLIRELRPLQAQEYIELLHGTPQADLLSAAASACRHGVRRSHWISYAHPNALLTELFTDEGSGTLIDPELSEQIRVAHEPDVDALQRLIAPLVADGTLVARSYEQLCRDIDCFLVLERDGLLIGCAALYPVENSDAGELSCLAIHSDYRHGGRGDDLLKAIECQAKSMGMKSLIVLTTRTAHWFRERSFVPLQASDLPQSRLAWYNHQRNSKVFEKRLK